MKLLSFFFFTLILGCGNGNNDSTNSAILSAETSAAAYETSDFKQSDESGPSEEIQEQKIIKNATLVFETSDLEATHKKILQLTTTFKGLVQDDNSGKDYNRIYKNVVVRIPTTNFQAFIDGISEGVAYFDQKNISQIDVTEEFVDIEARLKTKRELEERYRELLKQASSVKDLLEIERELSVIREEIEAKQGRLNYLQNKVSMSTVTIECYKITAETGVTQSYGQKIKNALQGGWNGISVFLLGLLYLWPLFVFAILVVFTVRWYLNKKKKN